LCADYARLYVHDRSGNLHALDAANGALIWTFPIGYVANALPNTSDNRYIIPGGTQTDPVNTNLIGVIKDFGEHANWVFKAYTYRPVSAAAFGRNARLVIMGRDAVTDALSSLVTGSNVVIVSATPWVDGLDPSSVTGIAVREDGCVFVNIWGQSAYKANRPVSAP
jgi:outer membrane protein assembly factor BamB